MINQDFLAYLTDWCAAYGRSLDSVQLFNESTIVSEEQQRTYAVMFQNFRGRFIETVIIPMFRIAKDPAVPVNYRQRILDGLMGPLNDELGLSTPGAQPHDQLYQDFARALGVSADSGLWDSRYYPAAIQDYNARLHGYMTANLGKKWDDLIGSISVYLFLERIDEFDYQKQLDFVRRFSLIRNLKSTARKKALEFYIVHANILDEHFSAMPHLLDDLWDEFQPQIEAGATFISDLQHKMYLGLSAAVLATGPATSHP